MAPTYKVLHAGDAALVVEFGETIDRSISAWVNALDERLNGRKPDGVLELVPTFRSLLIHYEPLVIGYDKLLEHIQAAVGDLALKADSGRTWWIPVCYDLTMAPDLPFVAESMGMSVADVVECHSSAQFHIYMLGFLPGQAYMGDNPPGLILPRREQPRLKIPAGTLAIAMAMTSIFPQETPCGWHLIGRSPVPMWDYATNTEPLLRANDQVRFRPVSERDYHRLRSDLLAGEIDLTPDRFALEFAQ